MTWSYDPFRWPYEQVTRVRTLRYNSIYNDRFGPHLVGDEELPTYIVIPIKALWKKRTSLIYIYINMYNYPAMIPMNQPGQTIIRTKKKGSLWTWFSGWLWFGLVSYYIYIEDMNISPVPGRGSLGSHLPTRINIDPPRFDLFLRFFSQKERPTSQSPALQALLASERLALVRIASALAGAMASVQCGNLIGIPWTGKGMVDCYEDNIMTLLFWAFTRRVFICLFDILYDMLVFFFSLSL